MGSPETCPKCKSDDPGLRWLWAHAPCPDSWHATPTAPAPADAAGGEPMPRYFTCPKCRSHEWGTSNCTSPYSEWVGHCHNYRCGFSWPREKDDAKYFEYAPAPDAGAERAVVEALRELFDLFVDVLAQGTARAASDHATGRCVITYDDGCISSYEDAFAYLGLAETPSKRWFTSDEFYAAVKAKGAALRGTNQGDQPKAGHDEGDSPRRGE